MLALCVFEVQIRDQCSHGQSIALHIVAENILVLIARDHEELTVLYFGRTLIEKQVEIRAELPKDQV